jgi:uncharacterized protein YjlB
MYFLITSLGQGLTTTAHSIGFVFFGTYTSSALFYIFRPYTTQRGEMDAEIKQFSI